MPLLAFLLCLSPCFCFSSCLTWCERMHKFKLADNKISSVEGTVKGETKRKNVLQVLQLVFALVFHRGIKVILKSTWFEASKP